MALLDAAYNSLGPNKMAWSDGTGSYWDRCSRGTGFHEAHPGGDPASVIEAAARFLLSTADDLEVHDKGLLGFA